MAKAQRPEITTLTATQLEALLAELRPLLSADYLLIDRWAPADVAVDHGGL